MKLTIIVLAFMSSFAFGSINGYNLKMDLSVNGKHVSSPQLIVMAGEAATITQKTEMEWFSIDVIATEGSIQNQTGILMKFVIGIIRKNGEPMIRVQPQILAKENELAQVTVSGQDGNEVSLSIIANRKAL